MSATYAGVNTNTLFWWIVLLGFILLGGAWTRGKR